MSIYCKLPNVTGSAQSKGYNGWIELFDINFPGVNTDITMPVGKSVDRCRSMPNFAQLSAVKPMDKSSNTLFQAVHEATVFPKAEIHYVTTAEPLAAYVKLNLSNVIISHYAEQFSHSGAQPVELIRMAYTKMERTFIPRDQNNKLLSPSTTGYDLSQAKRV